MLQVGLLLAVLSFTCASGDAGKPWVDPGRGKCDKFVAGSGSRPRRPRSHRPVSLTSSSDGQIAEEQMAAFDKRWPNKTPCVGHSYVPAAVAKRSEEDIAVPLCQGFDSPW
jgi:hypothetical protein